MRRWERKEKNKMLEKGKRGSQKRILKKERKKKRIFKKERKKRREGNRKKYEKKVEKELLCHSPHTFAV